MNFKMQKKNTTFISKIVTSEAFQRVTDETLQQSHLKFGTTGEAQNFRIKKNEKHRIMENNRINFQKKKRNVLASKLRPVKDFK